MKNQDRAKYLFVGLDLHKETHTALWLTAIWNNNRPSAFEKVIKELEHVAGDKTLIFGLEDVGGNGRSFALHLVGKGYIT